jgi:hypothetical protein
MVLEFVSRCKDNPSGYLCTLLSIALLGYTLATGCGMLGGRVFMRVLFFITLIGTALGFSTPAWSAWETYTFEDLGIIKDFPAEPERSETVYATPRSFDWQADAVAGAPAAEDSVSASGIGPPPVRRRGIEAVPGDRLATHFEVELDNIIYRMTVVNLQDVVARSANAVLECINLYEEAGVVVHFPARTGRGGDPQGGTWGREVTVDLPNNRGRVVGACYFTKGNLYRFESHILPNHGDMNALDAVRFTNAVEFRTDREFAE